MKGCHYSTRSGAVVSWMTLVEPHYCAEDGE
jgi:hypothetical protein